MLAVLDVYSADMFVGRITAGALAVVAVVAGRDSKAAAAAAALTVAVAVAASVSEVAAAAVSR